MKNKKDIIIILIILFTFMQGTILVKINVDKAKESQVVISEVVKEPTYIKDIDKSLSNLKNYNVINRKRDGETWIINIKLSGTKEEILLNLKSLEGFIIKSYNMTFNNNKCEVDLELKSRELT